MFWCTEQDFLILERNTCGKRVNRQINIAACVSLSATDQVFFLNY